jgi:hypothetical protein
MKNYLIALCALLVLTVGISSEARAEKKAAPAPQIEMLDDATVEKLAALGGLSEQHQLLATLIGTWYYEMRYWPKEGAEPQTSTGTATNEIILGGKYLLTKTSLILNIGGQNIPYEGCEMLGYDTEKKAFTSVWADSMHTGIIAGSGLYNGKLNAIEEKGVFKNPMDAKERPYRSLLYFADNGTYKRTFFTTGKSGKEFKIVEVTFERR